MAALWHSPLTDPGVQDYRTRFFTPDSPDSATHA
jgi:hypothetical protein